MVARHKQGSVLNDATHLWERWQALLGPFATVFTRPGWVRFVPWVTGMVLCWEEHTITQILTALGLETRWRVLEHFAVLVVVVDGDEKPWFLVTSSLDLSAALVVEAFTARFRQEDGCRDHKQRLGMEEYRAWTKEPVLRTFQVQLLALTRLRLLPCRLDQTWAAESWWSKPEWYAQMHHASIRDLCRLFWRHRAVFSQLLIDREGINKTPQALASQGTSASRAA